EPIRETAPPLSPDQATAKLASGVPLLRGETLGLDTAAFEARWHKISDALQGQEQGAAARALADALRRDQLTPDSLVRDVLAGRAHEIHARADALGLDAGLTATVLRLTLFPVFAHLGAAMTPLREGTRWEAGYCPVCGSWPLLGEFRGLEQT